MSLIRVEENSSFARDPDSGCIINIDEREYSLAKQRGDLESQLKTMETKVRSLEEQMALVFNKLTEIK